VQTPKTKQRGLHGVYMKHHRALSKEPDGSFEDYNPTNEQDGSGSFTGIISQGEAGNMFNTVDN